jgi:acyl-CoA dehydrogenase
MPTMGWMDDSLCEITFTDCRIPAENLLGEEGRGLSYAMSGLNEGRLNVGCQALGPAQIALDETIEHARTRVTFGQVLAEHQAIQHMIADMAMDLETCRLHTYRAAWLEQQGRPCGLEATTAKCLTAELATKGADNGIQVLGGYGYAMEYDMQRYWRDVRLYKIGPISSEMSRNYVGEQLGLPRSF